VSATVAVLADGASERVHRVLAEHWCGTGDGATTSPVGLRVRRGAVVASVPARAGMPKAFVKMHVDPLRFREESRGLSLAGRLADDPSAVRAPDLFRSIESERCLIIEHVDGVPLRSALRRGRRSEPDAYLGAARSLGRWLARYHALERRPATDTHFVDQRAEAVVQLLGRRKHWLGSARYEVGLRTTDAIRQALVAEPGRLAHCHGDFTLGNMLLRDGNVRVIDFGSAGTGLPEVDLAAFRASLRNTVGILPFSQPAMHALWTAFLGGYRGWSGAEPNTHALDLCEMYVVARSLAEPFDYPPPGPAKRLWELYVLSQNLRYLRSWLDRRAATYSVRWRDRRIGAAPHAG
jgi:tRNA A-37 threonylcarbamoyl transferase component Bud32